MFYNLHNVNNECELIQAQQRSKNLKLPEIVSVSSQVFLVSEVNCTETCRRSFRSFPLGTDKLLRLPKRDHVAGEVALIEIIQAKVLHS